MPGALRNLRRIEARRYAFLGYIAEVVVDTIDISLPKARGKLRRLAEGQSIRAVEGTVIPGEAQRSWQIAHRKAADVYQLQDLDIIVGLVRPERRNIGLLVDDGRGLTDVVGSPDGIAVVRADEEFAEKYPIGWLFEALRSEQCRLQLWTESGGTSYGKLTLDHIRNVQVPIPSARQRLASNERVIEWSQRICEALKTWHRVGRPADRVAIINSAIVGLESDA